MCLHYFFSPPPTHNPICQNRKVCFSRAVEQRWEAQTEEKMINPDRKKKFRLHRREQKNRCREKKSRSDVKLFLSEKRKWKKLPWTLRRDEKQFTCKGSYKGVRRARENESRVLLPQALLAAPLWVMMSLGMIATWSFLMNVMSLFTQSLAISLGFAKKNSEDDQRLSWMATTNSPVEKENFRFHRAKPSLLIL